MPDSEFSPPVINVNVERDGGDNIVTIRASARGRMHPSALVALVVSSLLISAVERAVADGGDRREDDDDRDDQPAQRIKNPNAGESVSDYLERQADEYGIHLERDQYPPLYPDGSEAVWHPYHITPNPEPGGSAVMGCWVPPGAWATYVATFGDAPPPWYNERGVFMGGFDAAGAEALVLALFEAGVEAWTAKPVGGEPGVLGVFCIPAGGASMQAPPDATTDAPAPQGSDGPTGTDGGATGPASDASGGASSEAQDPAAS